MWFRIFGQNVTSDWYQDVTFKCSKILFGLSTIKVSFKLEAMGRISLVPFFFKILIISSPIPCALTELVVICLQKVFWFTIFRQIFSIWQLRHGILGFHRVH